MASKSDTYEDVGRQILDQGSDRIRDNPKALRVDVQDIQ